MEVATAADCTAVVGLSQALANTKVSLVRLIEVVLVRILLSRWREITSVSPMRNNPSLDE